MKRRAAKAPRPEKPAALAALQRAAKKAVELARQTGTPAYILQNGTLVDAAKPRRRKKKSDPAA